MSDITHLIIDELALHKDAKSFFLKMMCKESDEIKSAAQLSLRGILKSITPKAAFIFYDNFFLTNNTLNVSEISISCPAFSQISNHDVSGVFVYALSAGDFYDDTKSITTNYYYDVWGSAYTDALRKQLFTYIGKDISLSDSFGPGYYGMDSNEVHLFDKLLDFKRLGIDILESGAMLPQKSACGLCFKTTDSYIPLKDSCKICLGNKKLCSLCNNI